MINLRIQSAEAFKIAWDEGQCGPKRLKSEDIVAWVGYLNRVRYL